jgi:hypothetical protein
LGNWYSLSWSKIGILLTCSPKLTTGPYSGPDLSSAHTHILFL